MRLLYSSIAVALFAFSAAAADYKAPSTSLKDVPSGMYEVDKNHASIVFSYLHMGFSHPVSRFKHFDATLNFDAAQPEASKLDVTIDTKSIDSGSDAMDAKFLSKELFDVAQYPLARFTSTKVQKLTATTGKVYGDLTLHGVTKPVVLDVTLNGAGPNPMMHVAELGFSARTTVSRSDFNLGFGVPMVSDKITILIEAEFQQKQQEAKTQQ